MLKYKNDRAEHTFADTRFVHHPDERRTELAVGRDAVLSGFKDVTHVLFHLQSAEDVNRVTIKPVTQK